MQESSFGRLRPLLHFSRCMSRPSFVVAITLRRYTNADARPLDKASFSGSAMALLATHTISSAVWPQKL